jgi:CheY-like chemotaxis protein
MLSSKDGLFDRARGRIVGSEHYLTKPFTRDELLSAIERTSRADRADTPRPEEHAMALVLIVDDSPTEVHVLSGYLKKHGFETEAAADGQRGLSTRRAQLQARPDFHGHRDAWHGWLPGATRALANDPATRARFPVDHGVQQEPGERQASGACARVQWTIWSSR